MFRLDPDLFRPLFNTFLYLLVCPKDILFVRYFKMYQDALVWFFTFLSWDFVAYRWRALYLCNIENVWELFTENHWETTTRKSTNFNNLLGPLFLPNGDNFYRFSHRFFADCIGIFGGRFFYSWYLRHPFNEELKSVIFD